MGKYYKQNDKTLLSLSIRVHHQLCGAYHVSHFINELQIMINEHKFIKE
ncbi:CatA-like O-acetyltransferase [Thomasclavelia ramosa]